MSNYSKLYWLTRLDGIEGVFIALCILSVIFCVLMLVGYSSDNEEYSWTTETEKNRRITSNAFYKKWGIFVLKFVPFVFIITILIPSKNDAIFIIAGGKTMDFVQGDSSINKIPAQTTKLITDFLQRQIEDAKK